MRLLILLLLTLSSASGQWYKSNLNLVTHPENLALPVAWEFLTTSGTYGVPDQAGGNTATRVAATATNNTTALRQPIWLQAGNTYKYSLIAKLNSGQWLEMGISDFTANACGQFFDLTNGVTGAASPAGDAACGAATITSLGGGWYRCTMTVTINTRRKYFIELRSTNGNSSYNTSAGQAIDIWQPQVNLGSSVLPYRSTTYDAKKFTYFGFFGTGPNTFLTAQSNDGTTWDWGTVQGAWKTTAGVTVEVNAPDVLRFRNQWLFHVAVPVDGDLFHPSWLFGRADSAGVVTTLATIDYTGVIPNVSSCFSGGFLVDTDGTVRLYLPCSTNDLAHFSIYETHPTNQSADPSIWTWSVPVLQVGLRTNSIDAQVFLSGATYYMFYKEETPRHLILASATAALGPWTEVQDLTLTEGWGATNEGPVVYHTTSATSWQIMFEEYVTTHVMYGTSCASFTFACSGTWTTKATWTQPSALLYRHGTVIRTPGPNTGAVLAMQ